jgi:hypothetical protein
MVSTSWFRRVNAAPGLLQRAGLFFADHPNRLGQRRPRDLVGAPSGQHFVQDDSQRIDIRAEIDLVRIASSLFRAHVWQRALDGAELGHHAPGRHVLIGDPGETEIQDLHVGQGGKRTARAGPADGLGDDDVRRLEVPVDDPALMGIVHSVGDPGEHPQPEAHLLGVEGPLPQRQPLIQGVAPDQLHGEEMLPLLGAAGLVDRTDVGMLQASQGLRLPLEQPRLFLADEGTSPHDLEGDPSPRLLLFCLVDDPDSTLAELAQDAVRADDLGKRFLALVFRAIVLGDGRRAVHAHRVFEIFQ